MTVARRTVHRLPLRSKVDSIPVSVTTVVFRATAVPREFR
jgi:hypothetical protein